jgi:GAF domain-containing protein
MYTLVEAELKRIAGESQTAMGLYEGSITLAHQNGYLCIEALAYELYARHLLATGFTVLANATFSRAIEVYGAWGAKTKVDSLNARYGSVLDTLRHRGTTVTLGTHAREDLDLMILVRAVQMLSQGIESQGLLERFVTLVVQSAGAEKGAVVLRGDRRRNSTIGAGSLLASLGISSKSNRVVVTAGAEEMKVAVMWDVRKNDRPHVFLSQSPLSACRELHGGIIQAVANSGQHVLIKNLQESDFSVKGGDLADSSVVCLPIYQGNSGVVGVMYLSHTAQGVFSRERLHTLELLCAQLGILLENSMLYESMQESKRMYVF